MALSIVMNEEVSTFMNDYLEFIASREFIHFCENVYEQFLTILPTIDKRLTSLMKQESNADPTYFLYECNEALDVNFNDCEKLLQYLCEERERLTHEISELYLRNEIGITIDVMEVWETKSLLSTIEDFIDNTKCILLRKKLPDIIRFESAARSKIILRNEVVWDQAQSFHGSLDRYFHSSLKWYRQLYDLLPSVRYDNIEKVRIGWEEFNALRYLAYIGNIISNIMNEARAFHSPEPDGSVITPTVEFNLYIHCEAESSRILNESHSGSDSTVSLIQYLHHICEDSLNNARTGSSY